MGFLPISKQDMEAQGIEQLDFVYVIGDAYVDHPSFGHAIISRVLVSHGYTVGIIYPGRRAIQETGSCNCGIWKPDSQDV